MHDLVIRAGLIVDGSGREPFHGDVAIDGDTITAVGRIAARGHEEIDARDHIVTPGFVDLHTHLDAQVGWDPFLTPLPSHGVTSAVLGNCGMTFAPVRPGDGAVLAHMMEAVEDIPATALEAGLPWCWESYGDYLSWLEERDLAINVAGMVGHCAVRFYVMGERAVDGQPSAQDISAMATVVRESLAAGAVGFSSSRLLSHVLPDGRTVPGTFADMDELGAIAGVLAEYNGSLLQLVPNLASLDSELQLIRSLAKLSGGRVLFSLTADDDGDTARLPRKIAETCGGSDQIHATTYLRGSGVLCGLVNTLPWQSPVWQRYAARGFSERLAGLNDATLCAQLTDDADAGHARFPLEQLYWLGAGAEPDYSYPDHHRLTRIAASAGEHPAQTFLRLSRESRGRALFMARLFNTRPEAVRELITSPSVLPTLGDAGAHVGLIMDAGWCTYLLAQLVREQQWFSLAEGVRRMTSLPAQLAGLSGRGWLAAGQRADINVIDLDRLGLDMPEYVHDLPGGAGRFTQRARGYRATLCNGTTITRNDEPTGRRAGKVLRNREASPGNGRRHSAAMQ